MLRNILNSYIFAYKSHYMSYKTKEDVMDLLLNKLGPGRHLIKLGRSEIQLFISTVEKYNAPYKKHMAKPPIQLINGTEIGEFVVVISKHDPLPDTSLLADRTTEKEAIANMDISVRFPFDMKRLQWVRTHVYTMYRGTMRVSVINNEIVVEKKDSLLSHDSLRAKIISAIENNRLPLALECHGGQIVYVRNIVSSLNKGSKKIKVSSIPAGCLIYDLSNIIQQTKPSNDDDDFM